VFDEESHLLCESQYAGADGVCSSGQQSLRKGLECDSDSNCPSDVDGQYAACRCSWNADKTKYCDILPGDDEWVDAREAFKTYYEATRGSCNTAARWEKCGQESLYNAW